MSFFCGFCEENQVEATCGCVQCNAYFCTSCAESIHSRGVFKMHKIVAVEELSSASSSSTTTTSVAKTCLEHEEKLTLFCTVDSRLVCSHCVLIGTHKGHECQSVKVAQQERQQRIMQKREALAGKLESVRGLLEKTSIKNDQLESQLEESAELQAEIASSIRRLQTLVNGKTNSMMETMQQYSNDHVKVLTAHIQLTHEALGSLEKAIQDLDSISLNDSNPVTFLSQVSNVTTETNQILQHIDASVLSKKVTSTSRILGPMTMMAQGSIQSLKAALDACSKIKLISKGTQDGNIDPEDSNAERYCNLDAELKPRRIIMSEKTKDDLDSPIVPPLLQPPPPNRRNLILPCVPPPPPPTDGPLIDLFMSDTCVHEKTSHTSTNTTTKELVATVEEIERELEQTLALDHYDITNITNNVHNINTTTYDLDEPDWLK